MRVALGAHIFGGVVALAALWIPLVTKKGGAVHRRAGWVYACSMWVAALAALVLCAGRLLDDNKANDGSAWLLAFLGLLAANGAATGIRAARAKTRPGERGSAFDIGSSVVFLAASAGIGVYGAATGSVLHLAFAALGVALAARQLRYWVRGPTSRMDWWYTHMANMLAACIGTVTAFAVVNLPALGWRRFTTAAFIAPGVLGGLAITVWTRYYRRKYARAV
ncbi:MAG: hypothetical protein ACJ8F1_22665 [Polyangia bacterium]